MNETDVYINGQVGGSKGQMVARFYWDCVLDTEATEKAGRKVYKDAPHILLSCDGGKRQIPKKATDKLIKQYPNEYKAFQEAQMRTPLLALGLKPYQIKDLEYFDIKCVEDFLIKTCPVGYEKHAQVAQFINQLGTNNEEDQIEIRSIGNSERERENVRTEEIQREQGDSCRSEETGQKENQQEVTFNYSWSI